MPISLHFHCLDYHCTTISGPCGPSLWSPFKWSPYSSVLGSETNVGCSRSLLSVFCSKKKVSLLFCKLRVLWCACLHWWVCSHCKAWVRHIRFSDHCPGEWLISNSEFISSSGSLRRPPTRTHPAEQDLRTNLIYWPSDMIWWVNIWDRILLVPFVLTAEVFFHSMVLGSFHLENVVLSG